MNAKKIMGAVLVALLAAALFVGAGSAAYTAPTVANGDTVFVYQVVDGTSGLAKGTWANGANTITFEAVTNGVAIIGTDIVEGTYTQGDYSIIVKYPTAVITGIAGDTNAEYSFIGGNLYESDVPANPTTLFTSATGIPEISADKYIITGSNGVPVELKSDTKLTAGEYKIQAYFNSEAFVKGIPANYLYGAVYTFTVVGDDEATIVADVDSILVGDIVKLTITAQPGAKVEFNGGDAFKLVDNQVLTYSDNKIVVPNTGKLTFAITTTADAESGDETIVVVVDTKSYEVDITIEKGTITAKTEAASYFVGDKITVIGTSTAGDVETYTLKGTNYDSGVLSIVDDEDDDANDFEFIFPTEGKKLDVGTYTLTLNTTSGAKAAVAIVLKQPFITIIEAPEVIVQGDDAGFLINAEATTGIAYYIFGTNYFFNDTKTTHPKDAKNEEIKNQFKIELDGKTVTKKMDAGQYFMVIQHPMYDGDFNILSFNEAIYLNTTGQANDKSTKLFDVDLRQTANAAQALCDALDSQNIDDMYVKYSFFVIGEDESFTISEIPSQIAQGTTLTISGVSTSNAGDIVTVEMISTAFAAVPKETVGSAAFIAVTTTVAEDGTWEVTFDTSDLNVDEYSLKVAVTADGETSTWKNVNINVVEAADEPVTPPTDEPGQDEPGQDEPVAPETPGFGALASDISL